MSCLSSSPPGVEVDRRRRPGQKAEAAEGRPALDMLDEFWFFSNTLGKQDDGKGMRRPPLLPKSPSTSSASGGRTKGHGSAEHHQQQQQRQAGNSSKSRFFASGCRRLLRTPSLPAPRIGMEEELPKDDEIVDEDASGGDQEVEVEDDDLNWSSIYEGVLRTRIAEEERRSSSAAALHRAPSMPVPPSATMGGRRGGGHETATMSTPSMPRLQHSHSTLERHCCSHTPTKPDRPTPRTTTAGGSKPGRGQPRRELRSFSAAQQPAIARHKSALQLQDKMWKSSSALESIEVQGFKDLGFVFDKEELRESLADVLPGLRDSKAAKPSKSSGSGSVSAGSGSASDNDDANGNGNEGAVGDGGIVRRPYLSEAWHHGARSAPPAAAGIRLQQADARSAAEMKDQIRMWAQAVACNVRQEC